MLSLGCASLGLVARPSSHTRPRPAPGAWKSVAKPCWVSVRSWCGLTGVVHVAPRSLEKASRRSYASGSGLFASIHAAASVPSPSGRTDGTSAALTTRSLPEAAVLGADHPDAVRSENLNRL